MKRETREVNGTASPSADVSFLYAQDRTTFGGRAKAFYNRYAKVLTIFALACILSVSGVLIAKISTDYSRVGSGNSEIATTRDVDVSALVDKYKEYFVPRDNGTVEFDYNIKQTRTVNQAIEAQDIDALDEYIEMLHNINALVDDGTMYIADDGNYYLSQSDVQTFTKRSGINKFAVRTESHKVLFVTITVPVGYLLDLSIYVAHVIDMVMTSDNYKDAFKNKTGALSTLETYRDILAGLYPSANALGIDVLETAYNIVKDMIEKGQSIYNAISNRLGSGVANVVDSMMGKVINLIAGLFYKNFIHPMGDEANKHYTDSDPIDTIEAKCNLLLGNISISSFRA